ncbi:MAG TPA: recombination mediator RecR [Sphingobacteriaceae bacterium]
MNFSSKLLEAAVNEFAQLPGIGEKTALRLVLHLLNEPASGVERFTAALTALKNNIQYCQVCRNISDHPVCEICSSPRRDRSVVCVVEDTRDVMAIENTNQYTGLYHVLGGLISPIEGVGPADLHIESLIGRVQEGGITEIILALNATMEGDTTIFYLYKKLKDFPVSVTTIARGISFGGEIEYADEVTLGRSIATRVPYQHSLFK